jgi:uncharacterized protein YgiB involved in biofilm formation
MKRSKRIGLVLIATASAVALAGCEPQQQDLQVTGQVFANRDECLAMKDSSGHSIYTPQACDAAIQGAKQKYAATAPQYASLAECEAQFGPAACTPGTTYGVPREQGHDSFVPFMVGYMMGSANNSTPLYYGPGTWHSGNRAIYAGGYATRPIGYYNAPVAAPTASFKSGLNGTTAMTPAPSLRGGFGANFHATAPTVAAPRQSFFGSSSGASARASGIGSSSRMGSIGASARGGFGGSAHGFSAGG